MGQSWDTPGGASGLRWGLDYKSGLQKEEGSRKGAEHPTPNNQHRTSKEGSGTLNLDPRPSTLERRGRVTATPEPPSGLLVANR
jgi:hypothetical protein